MKQNYHKITMENTKLKIPAIRAQTLEHIAQHLSGLGSGTQIVGWLQNWGVPNSLIEYPATKWRMVYSILNHYSSSTEKQDHEMLFKIIGEILHPLLYNGDKKTAETAAEDFNKYLEYDGLLALSDGKNEYSISETKNLAPVSDEDVLWYQNEELFQQEYSELEFLRQPENKEKISTLRKAYQSFMNIAEIFCEDPSKPSHELNDAYLHTKKLITDAVGDLHLYVNSVNGTKRIHTLAHYFIPFNNLFTAEKEYTPEYLEVDLSGKKLNWDYIRPRMHATYGCIDELYRKVDGSDVLSKPDVQQTLNDVSLLLSKTKEENKKQTEAKQKVPVPQMPVQKIEITAMPELQVRNVEDNTLTKGKKRIRLPKFKPTDWAKINIRFLNERDVLINADKKEQVVADYEALGFADEKRGKPNMAWAFFRGLAQNNGETKPLPAPIPDNIKQQKRQLSDRLKTIFKNDTDPFYDPTETHIYKIKINLIPPQSESEEADKLGVQEYLDETMTTQYEEKHEDDEM